MTLVLIQFITFLFLLGTYGIDKNQDIQLRAIRQAIESRNVNNKNVLVVLDGSGSIDPDDFAIMRDITNKFLYYFPKDTVIGVLLYSNDVKIVCPLTTERENCRKSLLTMEQPRQSTRTGLALEEAHRILSSEALIIILTDGEPTDDPREIAAVLKKKNVDILAIGIGCKSSDKLRGLVSQPEFIVMTPDFTTLWDIISQIVEPSNFESLRSRIIFKKKQSFSFTDNLIFEIEFDNTQGNKQIPKGTKLIVKEISRTDKEHFLPCYMELKWSIGKEIKTVEIDLRPEVGVDVNTLPENIQFSLEDSFGNKLFVSMFQLESYLFAEQVYEEIDIALGKLQGNIEQITIPVIGVTGSGKSTVINAIEQALIKNPSNCAMIGGGRMQTTMITDYCDLYSQNKRLKLRLLDTKGMSEREFSMEFLEALLQGAVEDGEEGNELLTQMEERMKNRDKNTAQQNRAHNLLIVITSQTVLDSFTEEGKLTDPNVQKLISAVQKAKSLLFQVKVVVTFMTSFENSRWLDIRRKANEVLGLPDMAYPYSRFERTDENLKSRIFIEDIQMMDLLLALLSNPNPKFDRKLKYFTRDQL